MKQVTMVCAFCDATAVLGVADNEDVDGCAVCPYCIKRHDIKALLDADRCPVCNLLRPGPHGSPAAHALEARERVH